MPKEFQPYRAMPNARVSLQITPLSDIKKRLVLWRERHASRGGQLMEARVGIERKRGVERLQVIDSTKRQKRLER
jgi:hypothetical protein